MIMSFDIMALSEPVGDHQYRLDVENASKAMLNAALEFEASYSEVYGHQIYVNLDEIKAAT